MEKNHVCPWWMGYVLLIPLRKYGQNPEKILKDFVKPGMKVIDYGCAMGYFSLPLANMVGKAGKVYCFDIQEKMLDKLSSRAKNAGVESIVEPRLVKNEDDIFIGLEETANFALLFAVVHEVPDKEKLFRDIFQMLKPGGRVLFAEPKGHINTTDFENSSDRAKKAGFKPVSKLNISRSHAVLFEKI